MSETYIPESFHYTRQKDISQAVDLFIHQQQLAASLQEDRDKARLDLLGVQGAGAWLNAVPSKALCLYLGTRELLAALKYILGVAVYPREGPCLACGSPSDRFGDHSLGCSYQGERVYRHNSAGFNE